MDRRQLMKVLAGGGIAAGALHGLRTAKAADPIHWKMVTTWPKNFPGLGTGANKLAQLINDMSGGRLQVKVYGAGELVPAFEVFDAVSRGTAQMGHGAAMYWQGKIASASFFCAMPFGFTQQEMNGWLYHGGGMQLWQETYLPFGVFPFPAGNSGVQMAGWFNKPINSMTDIKGMKMRIPGPGGAVWQRAGGTPVTLPGSEIFSALKSGAIDATEWISPYNDIAFGLHKVAKYYYYPGWHEPGTTLECLVNLDAFKDLPPDLQYVVMNACRSANADLAAEFTAQNAFSLERLKTEGTVQIKPLPDDVLRSLRQHADEVIRDMASKDANAKKVYQSFADFRKQAGSWQEVSEMAYYNARG